MPSVRLLKCTWRSWSSFTRSTNPFELRPRRSSFQTTRVSVSRKWESVSLSSGRSALAPLTLSVKIRLQLALLSTPILAMAAAQLKVPTGIWNFYAERDQTRREHLLELQEQFGYQAFTVAHYRRFALELDTLADQTHQGMRLAQALVESIRKAKIIIPGVSVLERLCAEP